MTDLERAAVRYVHARRVYTHAHNQEPRRRTPSEWDAMLDDMRVRRAEMETAYSELDALVPLDGTLL